MGVSALGWGQNLVPNPSFEDTVNCPTGDNQVHNAIGWSNFSNQSPDYFNSCSPEADVSVPNNWAGFQSASSGNAYCGMSTYFPNTPNEREIIGAILTNTLTIGTKYYFSMKVNLSINNVSSTSYATNKLGVRFSTTSFSTSNPISINNNAHITETAIISDTANWTTIFGSFIADSSYQFISIGNFYDDSNTDTLKVATGTPTFKFAYYYVDDICVSSDSMYTANFLYTGIEDSPQIDFFNLYPNPLINQLNIKNNSNAPYDIIIHNAIGQLLYQEKDIITNHKQIDISTYSKCLLLVSIKSNHQITNYKLIKH